MDCLQASDALTLRRVEWSDHAGDVLAGMPMDRAATLDSFRRQVESGAGHLIEVSQGAAVVGYAIIRVGATDAGPDLEIIAAAGACLGIDLVAAMVPAWETLARGAGCMSVTIHTERPGMVRKLARHGFGAPEVVLRKWIDR